MTKNIPARNPNIQPARFPRNKKSLLAKPKTLERIWKISKAI